MSGSPLPSNFKVPASEQELSLILSDMVEDGNTTNLFLVINLEKARAMLPKLGFFCRVSHA